MSTAAARNGDVIVVHAAPPRDAANWDASEHPWITRADHVISEALAGWTSGFPSVHVTRFVSCRPVVEAFTREGREVGLVVVGSHLASGPSADPIARESIAAMACPVAIVPHHPAPGEPDHAIAMTQDAGQSN